MKSRRWLWLLLLIPIGLGFMRLRFDVEVMNLLPDEFPVVRGLKLYQTNFANARELIITVEADEAEAAENAARSIAVALRAATNLTGEVTWQPLWLEQPGQSAELVAYLWLNQPPEIFGQLTNRLSSANLPNALREAQEALTTSLSPQDLARRGYDPFNLTQLPESVSGGNSFGEGGEFFSSADGTFRVVFAEARPDISDYRKCTRWLNQVKSVVTNALPAARLNDKVKVRYTGRPAFVSEISSGMQQDMAGPSGVTLLVIAVLFYFTHRRIKPLLWLTVLLLLILAGTMALGGLVFGTINVISLGFASILLGLAEDFGIVLYQESRSHPELSRHEIQKMAGPGIFWSAVTTCGAFLVLNLGGLPGLGQLGTLVAIGIALAAVVMLYGYLPPLMRKRDTTRTAAEAAHDQGSPTATKVRWPWLSTVGLLIVCAGVLSVRRPGFDNSPDALRPRNSPAYAAVEEIKQRLKRTQEPLWVLMAGHDEAEIGARLRETQVALSRAVSNGLLTSFMLPTSLWPNPENERANRAAAAALIEQRPAIREAVVRAGFTSNSLALTENIFATWQAASETRGVFWPTNDNSRWILDKLTARNGQQMFALGLIYRNTNAPLAELTPRLLKVAAELFPKGIYLSGWEVLGYSVFARVKSQFWKVLIPMFTLIAVSLWLAFRNAKEMLLSLATLAVSGLCLWAFMGAVGWSWNLLNLMALPLLLGMGVDFSIHIQLALTRYHGDLRLVRGSIGRALLLAGSTTVAGFASLAFSNNAGMASLGKVCGLGIVCAMLVSVYLLPLWWTKWIKK
jgi:predicted RND superfamily exporter protein